MSISTVLDDSWYKLTAIENVSLTDFINYGLTL